MSYQILYNEELTRKLVKIKKKDFLQYLRIKKKIDEIIDYDHHDKVYS